MEISESEKLRPLISLYEQAFEEMRRYRDMEWKILSWTITLMAGIIAVTRLAPIQATHKAYVQTLLCIFTVSAAIYGGWHIHYVHMRLTWYRKLRRKCDKIFKFFDDNVYDVGAILPKKWKIEDVSYAAGLNHLISWWILIALTATYAIYSIVFMKVVS